MDMVRVQRLIAKIGKTDKLIYKEGLRFYNKRYGALRRTSSTMTAKMINELTVLTLKKMLSMKRNKHHD